MSTPLVPEPAPFGRIAEVPSGEPPFLVHPGWRDAFPWLVQGTTIRGEAGDPFDLGIFSDASPARTVLLRWERLRRGLGFGRGVHAHQVHGSGVRFHGPGDPGLHLAEPCDGHVTVTPGVLLAVTVADCVPIFMVDPGKRGVCLLHAGWRGVAAGMLEEGLAVMSERVGSSAADLHVHFGPSVCGACYEVGPEVFEALGLPVPASPAPVDLRGTLARRAVAAGVPGNRISVSAHCTLCRRDLLFSHRGGDGARQVAFMGIRA